MRTGSAAIPGNAFSEGKITDPGGVARAIKPLLARTETTLTRAMVAVSDALATFRVIHLPPTAMNKDVDAALARELPFDPQRTATRWLELEATAAGRIVYAAAWDKGLLAAVIDAIKQSGLEPAVVELKSASVARAVPVATCVLVDLTVQPAEVVLIDRHLPQVWHSFSAEDDLGTDVAVSLAHGLRSILRFYRRHTNGEFAPDVPVYVSAEQALPPNALRELAREINQPAMALPAPPRVPTAVRHATYLTCLGLLMRRP